MNYTKEYFNYLSRLEDNNNRDWFKANKEEFDFLKEKWLADVQYIINNMKIYDDNIVGLSAQDSVYRIYRDIRFSPNKIPYKTYFSAVIGKGGRKCIHSCYYLHLQPNGQSGLYGGIWCPEPKILCALRHAIDDNIEEFEEIINEPGFKSLYNITGDALKTAPKGFDKNSPNIKYIRLKEFLLENHLRDSYFDSDSWKDKVVNDFMPMKKFHDFLNFTIDNEL
ncbi:MAG: DUF2461 domain-containing protein [Muribaculaceae bacterium]|nr:DUF2461 domain-containing protein [Muribaculaceae bacterium]